MGGQSPAGGPDSVPKRGPSDEPLLAPYNAPGPGSDDFNPNDHIWEGGKWWWSTDRHHWWDGAHWTSAIDQSQASSSGSIAAPESSPEQILTGQYSSDGRWWWDGSSWRQTSPDRRWWWDEHDWQPTGTKFSSLPDAKGGAIGFGCISMVVAFFSFFFAGGDLQRGDPGFAAFLGGIAIVLALAAAIWIFVSKGRLALYGWPVAALAISVLATALALGGGLAGGGS
jgi:hypothetical protein